MASSFTNVGHYFILEEVHASHDTLLGSCRPSCGREHVLKVVPGNTINNRRHVAVGPPCRPYTCRRCQPSHSQPPYRHDDAAVDIRWRIASESPPRRNAYAWHILDADCCRQVKIGHHDRGLHNVLRAAGRSSAGGSHSRQPGCRPCRLRTNRSVL